MAATTSNTELLDAESQLEPAIDTLEEVLPGVWRWADPAGTDRCGTALATPDGLVLIDPPAMREQDRRHLGADAGPVRHVVLAGTTHVALAAAYRGESVTVWAPGAAGDARAYGRPGDTLPGGLIVCQLPEDAAPEGEVALLWPDAGDGLLITGDALPVVGQTPVYREGEAPPITAYLDCVKALLAADPGTLAPAHHAPFDRLVAYSTAYAAHIGRPYHARNAAPVAGPRYLVPRATRVLEETLVAPVVVRRPVAGGAPAPATERDDNSERPWIPDPFACAHCGKPTEPAVQTCGGPLIPRLCPECRALRRQIPPAARLMICAGGCCTRAGARAVASAARQAAAARGLDSTIDVMPVSCLGECSVGPFVRVATAQNEEPEFAARFREQTTERARRYAADEGELVDDETELVLSRFAALVQPDEAARLVQELARGIEVHHGDTESTEGE